MPPNILMNLAIGGLTMRTIRLGNSDLEVSELSLGCLYFGARDSQTDSFDRLYQYIEGGGNFLDTANIYSHWINDAARGGESEEMLGLWFKQSGLRNHVVLASKLGFPYPGTSAGLSAGQIEKECDKSLKRLGVDTIDLYYAHVDDYNTPVEETMNTFNRLIRAGKIRALGASNFKAWRLEESLGVCERNNWTSYCCVQQRYSYLRPKSGWNFGGQKAANDDLLEYVKARNLTLLAYSPLLNGAYTDPAKKFQPQYIGPDSEARLAVLHEVRCELGCPANQLVYAWLLQSDPPAIPLVASSNRAQLEESLAAVKITLSEEQLHRLSEAKDIV